jgi:two-component system sensor histidine kinase MtrB
VPAVHLPGSFRLRLTLAFILVASTTTTILAGSSYAAIVAYRNASFERGAKDDAQLALLAATRTDDAQELQALLTAYRERAGFETIAVARGTRIASTPGLATVTPRLRPSRTTPAAATDVERLAGRSYLVVAAHPRGSLDTFWFLFPRGDLLESLRQVRTVLALTWLAANLVAAAFGGAVARRTLRPVRRAAEASRSLAEGLLSTRLPPSTDEFGQWADAFNEMAEALEAKLSELESTAQRERQFTADVAHELRNPLAAMATVAAVLDERTVHADAELREVAELLVEDVRRLARLVDELLELARFDAGQETARVEPTSVARAVEAVARPWDGTARVAIDVPADLVVVADRARFRRVVANLIDNAVRHGRGAVEITAAAEPERGVVAVTVRDHGPGLPTGAGDVFARFSKGDPARAASGSGLGLAIALANARAQGGSLVAENAADGGARFVLRLPMGSPGDIEVSR